MFHTHSKINKPNSLAQLSSTDKYFLILLLKKKIYRSGIHFLY